MVHLFVGASDGHAAFTTSLRLDVNFTMTSCILRPDAARHTGLGLQFCGQSGKLSAHDFEAQTMKPATDCFEAQTIKPAFDGFRAKPSNLLHTLQGVTHPRF